MRRWLALALLLGALLVPFFGPGGLSGYQPSPPGGLDPQFMQQLLAAFPGLQQMTGGQQQGPQTLANLGYQGGLSPQLFQGMGQSSFNLSPFEGVSGTSPESVTAGLAQGTFGRSASISPLGTPQQSQGNLLSLPTLQLPMAQTAATQGGFGGGMESQGVPAEPSGGFTVSAGDVLGAGQQALNLFGGDNLGTQTTTPGYAEQRAGERDLSTLGGSFLPSYAPTVYGGGSVSSQLATQLYDQGGSTGASVTGQLNDALNAAGETMYAPGGASAQQILGPPAPQGDLLGGGLSTLQGLSNLYGGTQTGDIGQLLSGAGGTLGGLGQMAPETVAALSQSLGLGAGGLGLAAGGLGGLAGGYGLYQGIQQGDPLQALMGAGGLYAGAAPLVNAAFGTALPTLSSLGSSALGALGLGAGAATGALGAGTGAALAAGAAPASIGAAAMGGSVAGGAATGVGGGATGATAGATGAAAPIATIAGPIMAAILLDSLFSGGKQSVISDIMDQYKGNFPTFIPELQRNVGQQGTAFDTLQQALPYVQSKEELGQLLNTYTNYLGTTTGIAPEQKGGAFAGDPYSISAIPGVGPVTHGEQTQSVDWANQTQGLQRIIDQMLGVLPGERLTAQGGGLEGEAGMRLWTQFMDRERNAPLYSPGVTGQQVAFENGAPVMGGGLAAGYYDPYQLANVEGGLGTGIQYGQPGYQYAGSGFPEPGKYLGQPSAAWQTVEQNLFNATPQGQYAQQYQQALDQYIQQMQGLNQQAPQLLQGAQASLQGAPVPAMAGGPAPSPGGGMDLERILRELGYLV